MLNGFPYIKYFTSNFRRALTIMSSEFVLNFDNQTLKQLPTDDNVNNTIRTVKGFCFVRVKTTPVQNPKIVAISPEALKLLNITNDLFSSSNFIEAFSGNKILPGSEPAAHCYCGHQFGYFAGQLGDGAAIYLGEIINKDKERWEVQLKGAGLTPFSRSADGRKVLRSSIREFLCSEAMHYLNVPTTRAGTCITSDTRVWRDVFYDGNPTHEKCTIVSRIAPTFIRFGSFEIAKGADRVTGSHGPSVTQPNIVQTLTDFVIKSYYPEIWNVVEDNKEKMYLEFFEEVVKRTARLVAKWQCVGFCHGVLNTDNMSIIGLTIDYGPYGFLDRYDPNHICNASDTGGRYTFAKQPEICRWNLLKLAEALQLFVPMLGMKIVLDTYEAEFEKCYLQGMRDKLGLLTEDDKDREIINSFLSTMQTTGADFTNSFRCLSTFDPKDLNTMKESLLKECSDVQTLVEAYKPQMDEETLVMLLQLAERDPAMSINNRQVHHLVQTEKDKLRVYNKYKNMSELDKQKADGEEWSSWLQKYKQRLSQESNQLQTERIKRMNSANPKFILRNHLLQEAIEQAEKDDFSQVEFLLKLSEKPFDELSNTSLDIVTKSKVGPNSCSKFYGRPSSDVASIKVT